MHSRSKFTNGFIPGASHVVKNWLLFRTRIPCHDRNFEHNRMQELSQKSSDINNKY